MLLWTCVLRLAKISEVLQGRKMATMMGLRSAAPAHSSGASLFGSRGGIVATAAPEPESLEPVSSGGGIETGSNP
jgi:hypothetical protein